MPRPCPASSRSTPLRSVTGLARIAALSFFLAACTKSGDAPVFFFWSNQRLVDARASLAAGEAATRALVEEVVTSAEAELTRPPRSVTDHRDKYLPTGATANDYISIGPYWWPNPGTSNGLPYIRKDGRRNPEAAKGDYPALTATISAIRDLSLAWWFTQDARYAEHAVQRLRTWFIAPSTRMLPHMRYAQAIPGINEGRATGMIDAARLYEVIDAIEILRRSRFLTREDNAALNQWFSDFLTWYLESDFGRELAGGRNNITTWYYAQIGAYAAFTGRLAEVIPLYRNKLPPLVEGQILNDGRQPEELARTQAMSYSAYNLLAWECITRLTPGMNLDYSNAASPVGKRLAVGLRYLADYASPSSHWPHPELSTQPQRDRLTPLFIRFNATEFVETDPTLNHVTALLRKNYPPPAWLLLTYGSKS